MQIYRGQWGSLAAACSFYVFLLQVMQVSVSGTASHMKNLYQYYNSRKNPYQVLQVTWESVPVLQVTRESVSVLQVTQESISGTASHVRIRIRYCKSRTLCLNVQWNRRFIWLTHYY